jgi:ADP-ribose pyrophosphatase YjhB (NUDIX family)
VPNVRVSVAVVRDRDILLIRHRRRARAYWVVPGGRVQEFEPLDAAAIREIREETGLEVRLGPLVATFEINDRWTRHVVDLVFVAESFTGSLSEPAGGPLVESLDRAEFVDPAMLPALDVRPPQLRPLLEQLSSGARPIPRYLGDLTSAAPEDET